MGTKERIIYFFESLPIHSTKETTMSSESPLKDKVVLVVDDEPDILEIVEEELDMCIVHKAQDYDTGMQYLLSYTHNIENNGVIGPGAQ